MDPITHWGAILFLRYYFSSLFVLWARRLFCLHHKGFLVENTQELFEIDLVLTDKWLLCRKMLENVNIKSVKKGEQTERTYHQSVNYRAVDRNSLEASRRNSWHNCGADRQTQLWPVRQGLRALAVKSAETSHLRGASWTSAIVHQQSMAMVGVTHRHHFIVITYSNWGTLAIFDSKL